MHGANAQVGAGRSPPREGEEIERERVVGPCCPAGAAESKAEAALCLRTAAFRGGLLAPLPLSQRELLHQLPLGVILTDRHGHVLELSDTAANRLGVFEEFALGRPIDEVLSWCEPTSFRSTELAGSLRVVDRLDDAFEALERAERLATKLDDARRLSAIHVLRGNLYYPLGRITECLGQHELARDTADTPGGDP